MNYLGDKEKAARFKTLKALPENQKCVDCAAKFPQWATASFGTFICMDCSSRHRGLGPQVSFVRSITMDNWSERELQTMELGGNKRFKEFCRQKGVGVDDYRGEVLRRYKQDLERSVAARLGEEEVKSTPEPAPKSTPTTTPASVSLPQTVVQQPLIEQNLPTSTAPAARPSKKGFGAKKISEKINVDSLVTDDLQLQTNEFTQETHSVDAQFGLLRLNNSQTRPGVPKLSEESSAERFAHYANYSGISSNMLEQSTAREFSGYQTSTCVGNGQLRSDNETFGDSETPFMHFVHRATNKLAEQTGVLISNIRERLQK